MSQAQRPIYLDYAATTPVDPEVAELVMYYMTEEFGNAGSRTHEYGARAKQAVEKARAQIGAICNARSNEVIFTSGATESNNIAIIGLAEYGKARGKTHIITSAIEHKAVLEPCKYLENRGFEISYIPPNATGQINSAQIAKELRGDTLLVSVMQANNETGAIQPIDEISILLSKHGAFFHVDAAQSFCKVDSSFLQHNSIDLISISGHKIGAPKGIGALIAKGKVRSCISPIMFGGGQELGIRPGTLAVPLIAGFGQATENFWRNKKEWNSKCTAIKKELKEFCDQNDIIVLGSKKSLPNLMLVSLPDIDSEASFVVLKNTLALSNGSACTSSGRSPSHVLSAMQQPSQICENSLRLSWDNNTQLKPILDGLMDLLLFSK